MASLFRERRSLSPSASPSPSPSPPLPAPFGSLALPLSDPDLRHTAYDIFLSASRTSAASRPLTYTPQPDRSASLSPSPSSPASGSPSLQRSLTSAAASKVKKALGFKPRPAKGTPPKKAATIADLMRLQMRVPDQADARIRRALLRIAASQVTFSQICFFASPFIPFYFPLTSSLFSSPTKLVSSIHFYSCYFM